MGGHNHYCYRCRLLRIGKYTDDSVIDKCGKYSYLPGGNITTSAIHGLNPGQYTKLLRINVKEFAG